MTVSQPLSIDPPLEERLGYQFRDHGLLRRALTHASMGPSASNERLEFLGDRVLGLVVAERLYMDFPGETEGGLALRLNALVRRDACAQAAEAMGLGVHLIMTSSEAALQGRSKAAILAGACEAVIAAIYLDGGLSAAREVILRHWEARIAALVQDLRDAKTALQEWAQSGALKDKVQPRYVASGRSGPDHAPLFTVEVHIPGYRPQSGSGPAKRDAEQDAARRMLVHLGVWAE